MNTYTPKKISTQIVSSILFLSTAYALLFLALKSLPLDFQKNGFFKDALDLSYLIKGKALHASKHMNEANLAVNFIGNMRKLSFSEARDFQTSGLVHLLAISGAQIVPIASLFSSVCAAGFYYAARKKLTSAELMIQLHQLKTILNFGVSFFITLLFGCTGALFRVAGLSFLIRIKFVQNFCQNSYKWNPYFMEHSAGKMLLLILLSSFFGNVFLNYSFLLSAMGASCAEISVRFVHSSFFKMDEDTFLKRKYAAFLQSAILKNLLSAVLTSIFVGVLLSPLVYNSILNSCLANICAIPVVTFLITPLSLAILIIPENSSVYFFTVRSLDFSLSLLKTIAHTFHDAHADINPFDRNNSLFTKEGLFYLNAVLVLLWVCVDVIKYRKVFLMRSQVIHATIS